MRDQQIIGRLADYVRSQDNYNQSQHAFVSIYRHHRCYGGQEEGGWWYDRYELEGSIEFATRDDAEEWLRTAKAEVARINREEAPARWQATARLPDCDEEALPDAGEGYIPTGWDDGGELWVTVEDKAGEHDDMHEPRPHYE